MYFIAWNFENFVRFFSFPHLATISVDVHGSSCCLTVKVVSSFSLECFSFFSGLWIFSEDHFSPPAKHHAAFAGSLGSSSDPATAEPSGLLQNSARPSTHSRGMVKVQDKSDEASRSPSRNKSVQSLVVKVWTGLVSFPPLLFCLSLSEKDMEIITCAHTSGPRLLKCPHTQSSFHYYGCFVWPVLCFSFCLSLFFFSHTCVMTCMTSVLQIHV